MAQVSFYHETRLKSGVGTATSSLWPLPKTGTWIHTSILHLHSQKASIGMLRTGARMAGRRQVASDIPDLRAHLPPSTPECFFIQSNLGVRDFSHLPHHWEDHFVPMCSRDMCWRTQIVIARPWAIPLAMLHRQTLAPTAFTTGLSSLPSDLRWSHHSVICDVLKHSLHCKKL